MIFTVTSDGRFDLGDRTVPCALGKGGVRLAEAKREGDGATPLGTWPMRYLIYRPDRESKPTTTLPTKLISPSDGWCDAPDDPAYNSPVRLPYPASAEHLWREDRVYDLVVVLGHNDDPPISGFGSAIFLHLARPNYPPTEGCIALARDDMLALLVTAAPGDVLKISQA